MVLEFETCLRIHKLSRSTISYVILVFNKLEDFVFHKQKYNFQVTEFHVSRSIWLLHNINCLIYMQ